MLAHKLRSAAIKPTSGSDPLVAYSTATYSGSLSLPVLTNDVVVALAANATAATAPTLSNLGTYVSTNSTSPLSTRLYIFEATSNTTITSALGGSGTVAVAGVFRGFQESGRVVTAWRSYTADATMRYNQITGIDVGWLVVALGAVDSGNVINDEPSTGYSLVGTEYPTSTSYAHVLVQYKIAESTTELPSYLSITSAESRTIVVGLPIR